MPERITKRKTAAAPKAPPPKPARPAAQEFALELARLLTDDKCRDVVVLDVRSLSQVSDYIVVGTGSSDRQMVSVLEHAAELGDGRGHREFRRNVDDRSTWLLIDFVDVVVHLFEPNTRAHYDLEMLWGDAPRLDWEKATPRPARAKKTAKPGAKAS